MNTEKMSGSDRTDVLSFLYLEGRVVAVETNRSSSNVKNDK